MELQTTMDTNNEKPRFKDDAESKVFWEFPSKPQKLGGGRDVSKIKLSLEPSSMLEKWVAVEVEIQSGGGQFKVVDEESHKLGGKWQYTIKRVPCEEQTIRFFAVNDVGKSVSPFTKKIAASPSEEIAKSKYELRPPGNVEGRITKDKLSLSWEESKCAQDYSVQLVCVSPELPGLEKVPEETVSEPRYELDLRTDQRECIEWDATVTALLGENKYSDPSSTRLTFSDTEETDTRILSMETHDTNEPDTKSMATKVPIILIVSQTLKNNFHFRLLDGKCLDS